MFLKNDFDNYRQSLRNCGLSDLDFEPFYYSYDFEKDFDSAENYLILECHLGSFKSDNIDFYYRYFPGYYFSREYKIGEFAPLLHAMSSIWRTMEKSYTYKYDGSFIGYVTVKICEPYEFDKLTITSSAGHIYEYSWSWAYPLMWRNVPLYHSRSPMMISTVLGVGVKREPGHRGAYIPVLQNEIIYLKK